MKKVLAALALVVGMISCKGESYPPPAATPTPIPTVAGCPCVGTCPDWKAIGPTSGGVSYQNTKTGEIVTCPGK